MYQFAKHRHVVTRPALIRLTFTIFAGALLAGAACSSTDSNSAGAARNARHEDLAPFFAEWRTFQKPKLVDGVPDYTPAAMTAQRAELADWRKRLAAFDTAHWTIAQQVDWQLVSAEMYGLDFDHRVLKPWANNPAFYVTVFTEQSDQPAREGPFALGGLELWTSTFPLSVARAAELKAGFRAIPTLLAQGKSNLTGTGKDLWIHGTASIRSQGKELAAIATAWEKIAPELVADVRAAQAATDSFATWLDVQAPGKTAPSGIGVANYNWYLTHVQLVPLTWQDEVTLMERELARALASLRLEEARNRALPPQLPIASAAEHLRRFPVAVRDYMKFLQSRHILTITPDLEPALLVRVGAFNAGPREFFTEVDYRDPTLMRTHGYHWFDLANMVNRPHANPIRRGPLLYNIFNTRTEGNATGWEELMMHAGMLDNRPRSRELVWILLAERAARALGDLHMQGNEFTLEQASQFASDNTPRQWLKMSGNLVRSEQHLYLQQPGYGTSYIVGKIDVERLIAERARQLGDKFTMQAFSDEFNRAGLIPASLLRWELTGSAPDVVRMLKAP